MNNDAPRADDDENFIMGYLKVPLLDSLYVPRKFIGVGHTISKIPLADLKPGDLIFLKKIDKLRIYKGFPHNKSGLFPIELNGWETRFLLFRDPCVSVMAIPITNPKYHALRKITKFVRKYRKQSMIFFINHLMD